MKFKLAAAVIAIAAPFAHLPAHAGAIAMADMNISALGLFNANGAPANPGISIITESRTGTAASNYNGVAGTGVGSGSLSSFTIGGTVDVGNRCAGACGAGTAALYAGGGGMENNVVTHLQPPPAANFALGDMLIQGSAIGGTITGLTRANASATGPTNSGGANATILNTASVDADFTVGTTFTGTIGVFADAYLRTWVDLLAPAGQSSTAGAGYGWILTVTSNDPGFSPLFFNPLELNRTSLSTSANGIDTDFSFTGLLHSASRTYNTGFIYSVAINQSSNAVVSSIPEPASLALVGLALAGVALTARRRKS